METVLQSLPLASIPKAHHSSSSASSTAISFHCNAFSVACSSATRNFPKGFLSVCPSKAKDRSGLGAVYASQSQAETPPAEDAEKWLLVPIGQLYLLLNLVVCRGENLDKSLSWVDDVVFLEFATVFLAFYVISPDQYATLLVGLKASEIEMLC